MFLLKIFFVLIISFIIYKEVIKGRKTPSLNMNLQPILYGLGLAGVVYFIASYFFPNFWERYSNSDLFLPSIVAIIFCLYMWSQKYFIFMALFFGILILVLSRFGDFRTEKNKNELEVNFTIKNLDNGQVYYGKTSRNKPFVHPLNFRYTITPEYGKGIILNANNWSSPDTLVGGGPTDGFSELHRGNIIIVPL